MEKQITLQKKTRNHYLNFLENHTIKELSFIPKGFNNNLFWNIAHVVTTQQLLCYYLSDVPMKIDNFWVENFKKGTIPSIKIEKNLVSNLVQILTNQPNEMLKDYTDGVFKSYKTYETSFGTILNSIDDAIRFNNIHEGLHLGYMMAMKKLL
jgi:hypothetical protein